MRVVVIGSKPNSYVPDGDVFLFCNGAVALSRTQRGAHANIHVASGGLFRDLNVVDATRENSQAHKRGMARQKEMFDVSVDQTYIVRPKGHWIDPEYQYRYKTKQIIFLSQYERDEIVKEMTGLRIPINNHVFSKGYLISLLNYKLRRIPDVPHQYKPSTGIFAILFALKKFKAEKLVISGIGVSGNAYEYRNHSQIVDVSRSIRGHLPADIVLLKQISKKYSNVYSTDEELCMCSGIKVWG